MEETHHCYFLVFRNKAGDPIDWDTPTGGLVVLAEWVVYGHAGCDIPLVRDIIEQRYHCGPSEQLVLAEVFDNDEKYQATLLHKHWDMEMHDFKELMLT